MDLEVLEAKGIVHLPLNAFVFRVCDINKHIDTKMVRVSYLMKSVIVSGINAYQFCTNDFE
jgi:hypothetical protein